MCKESKRVIEENKNIAKINKGYKKSKHNIKLCKSTRSIIITKNNKGIDFKVSEIKSRDAEVSAEN